MEKVLLLGELQLQIASAVRRLEGSETAMSFSPLFLLALLVLGLSIASSLRFLQLVFVARRGRSAALVTLRVQFWLYKPSSMVATVAYDAPSQ